MAELPNPKHEQFAQHIARGLSPTKAYISAGFSPKGASTSASRLLRSASVCSRIAELKQLVCISTTQTFLELAITERDQRLMAIQDRWDRVREAIVARAAGDYKRMMATGVVSMRLKSVRGKNNVQRVYREYEIDTGVIEALNSVERRAAIETGQEVDRSDIGVRFGLADQAAILQKAFSLDELEAMDARIEAARKGTQVIEAPALAVPDVQPVPDQTHIQGRSGVGGAEAVDQANSEGKRDPAGDGRTGRGTDPGKLPGKHGFASATSTPRSWRD